MVLFTENTFFYALAQVVDYSASNIIVMGLNAMEHMVEINKFYKLQ